VGRKVEYEKKERDWSSGERGTSGYGKIREGD